MKLANISIEKIPGAKPAVVSKLAVNNIHSVHDLLHCFPKKYERYEVQDLSKCHDGDNVTVEAIIVTEPRLHELDSKKNMLSFRVAVNNKILSVVIFNREFLMNSLTKGKFCHITGKIDLNLEQIVATKIHFGPKKSFKEVVPVYGFFDIKDSDLTTLLSTAYVHYFKHLEEDLPQPIIEKYELLTKRELVKVAHFPNNFDEVEDFYRRVKFEELFKFQLKLQYLRLKNKRANGTPKAVIHDQVTEFIDSLPVELTGDQKNAIDEIIGELKEGVRANRLLQGDVGSGKTMVAAVTMYANYTAGYQSALMAPTEILAEQHYRNVSALFEKSGIRVELLTGSTKGKKREEILAGLANGEINIIVGTHALFSEAVIYKNLGYVITDEQHRFGVSQRKAFKEKGIDPYVLFMTATPIPRTLAITIFGDMEVSTIKELPNGRKAITTDFMSSDNMRDVFQKIQDTVIRGEQVYIVAPLIDGSEKLSVMDAKTVHNELVNHLNGMTKIGILHGKMRPEEKDQVMHKFVNNEIDVLVATTVIEVGVDVKNATLMVILDSSRFGLSQLHQLRGRIGRGDLESSCILVNNEITHRIQVMLDSNDGFEISEEDLKLRGPGEFFGSRQSGVPEFAYANILDDYKLVETTRREANKVVHTKEFYTGDVYKPLRKYLKQSMDGITME